MHLRSLLPVALVILTAACSAAAPSAPPTAEPTSSAAPTSTAAPAGFATPEDAVTAYLTGVANADVDAILATAAVDEAAENFDFEAQADRLRVLTLIGNPGPAEYPFYADINRAWFSSRLLGQTQALSYSLLSPGEIGPAPVPVDEGDAGAFVDQVDPAGLAGLEVVEVKPPLASLENDPDARANALEVAAIYGATDDVQRVALVKLGESHFVVGFELLKYGDSWKVITQTSSLAGMPGTGVAQPTTPEEFESQTSQ